MSYALTIEMAANVARLQKDLDDAKKSVTGFADSVAGLAKSFAAITVVSYAVTWLSGIATNAAAANAKIADLSTTTGISAAALRAFKGVGDLSNTTLEDITASSTKLSKTLADPSTGASAAMAALGLSVSDLQKMKPEDQMLAVATALGGFADGGGKSAVAMELLGKQGAAALPFLKELAERSGEVSEKIDTQSESARIAAQQAKLYEDNIVSITSEQNAWKKAIGEGLLPVMAEASGAFLEAISRSGGLKDTIRGLSTDGSIAEWGRGTVTALSYVSDAVEFAVRTIRGAFTIVVGFASAAMLQIGGVIEAASKAKNLDFKGAWDSMRDGSGAAVEAVKLVGENLDDLTIQKSPTFGMAMRANMEKLRGVGTEAREAKPELDFVAASFKAGKEKADELTKEYDRLIKSADSMVDKMRAEVEQGEKLTPAQEKIRDLTKFLNENYGSLTETQRAYLTQMIAEVKQAGEDKDALEKKLKAQQELKKGYDDLTKKSNEYAGKMRAEIDLGGPLTETQRQVRDMAEFLTENYANLTQAERDEITAKIALIAQLQAEKTEMEANKKAMDDANVSVDGAIAKETDRAAKLLATKDALNGVATDSTTAELIYATNMAAMYQAMGQYDLAAKWESIAQKVRVLADQKTYNDALDATNKAAAAYQKAWSDAATTAGADMTNALFDAVEKGGSFFDSLIASVKKMFKELILRPVIQPIMTSIAGGMMGMLGFAPGAASAATGGGGSSMLSGATGIAGAIGGMGGMFSSGLATTLAGNTMGGLTAAAGLIESGSVMSGAMMGLGAAMPYLAAAMAVYMAIKKFTGGETRYGAQYGVRDGKAFKLEGPSGGDPAMKQTMASIEATQRAIDSMTRGFGGSAGGQITRVGYEQSKESGHRFTEIFVGGQGRRQYGYGSNEEVTAAFATDLKRGVLMGLQQSDIQGPVKEFFASFNALKLDESQVDTVIAYATAAQSMADSTASLGGVFTQLSGVSVDARSEILALVGGLDAFNQKVASYVDNYYSDAEKTGMLAQSVEAKLRAVGINPDDLKTKEDFRAMVDSLDLTTESGREQLAALLNVQGDFAKLTGYMEESGKSLDEIAKGAPIDRLSQLTQDAKDENATALENVRAEIASMRDAVVDAINEAAPDPSETQKVEVTNFTDMPPWPETNGGGA